MSALATRFAKNHTAAMSRDNRPLALDTIRSVAPSIFAEEKHASRSERYAYVPTSFVLEGLRNEGFEPFFAAQGKCRIPGKTEFTKHMLRLRHVTQIAKSEVNEIIIINSHDGTSSYQMLAGVFRFVCCNGMVCGDIVEDIRIKHTGNQRDNVIEGAFRVLDQFERVSENTEAMKLISLAPAEQHAFATAALALRFGERVETVDGIEHRSINAPVTADRLLQARRVEDVNPSLWTTFNRVQENTLVGGLQGRNATGRRATTRPVTGVTQSVDLNRALWTLAEEMRKIKG